MNEDIKDIIEILQLAEEEIENNDENITATLDLQDLKSLKKLHELYQAEKEKNKEFLNKLENSLEFAQTSQDIIATTQADLLERIIKEFKKKYYRR